MKNDFCRALGIEFPIFAFSHCSDVVAAVSRAGGFGVLGAAGFTPEQLAHELDWITAQVGDRPFGIDKASTDGSLPQRWHWAQSAYGAARCG